MPSVSYSSALPTHLVRLFHELFAPYLCTVKLFLDGFVAQQKLTIFQESSKALLTVVFLNGSKNSRGTFSAGKFFKHI